MILMMTESLARRRGAVRRACDARGAFTPARAAAFTLLEVVIAMTVLTVLVGVMVLSMDLMGEHSVAGQARAERLRQVEVAAFTLQTDLLEAYAPLPPPPEGVYRIGRDPALGQSVLEVRFPRLEEAAGGVRFIRYRIEAPGDPAAGGGDARFAPDFRRLVREVDLDGNGRYDPDADLPLAGHSDLVARRVLANDVARLEVVVVDGAFRITIEASPIPGETGAPLRRIILVRPRNVLPR